MTGKLSRALLAIVREAFPRYAFAFPYRYRVTDMVTTRVRLQAVKVAPGLPDVLHVSVLPGVAGAAAELKPGSLVLVQFVEGDPAQPIVTHFEAEGGEGWLPISLTLDASSTLKIGPSDPAIDVGPVPTEHATSAEALVSMFDAFCTAIAISFPGATPLTGGGIVGAKAALINAAIPLTATVPITLYSAALTAALAAKLPDAGGDLPSVGWPKVRGS